MSREIGGTVIVGADELRAIVRDAVAEALADRVAPADEPLLLTCSKLAKKIGVSRVSIYRWRQEGMPSVPCGDDHRYELDAVLAWLRGRA